MAFTGREFFDGAFAAWGWFVILIAPATVIYIIIMSALDTQGLPSYLMQFPQVLAILGLAIISAYFFLVPWTFAGLLVGGTVAYGLGFALRRTRNLPLHVTAFAILGLVVGVATSTVGAIFYTGAASLVSPTTLGAMVIYSLVTAVAVALGWLFTASNALRADAREERGT